MLSKSILSQSVSICNPKEKIVWISSIFIEKRFFWAVFCLYSTKYYRIFKMIKIV